MMQDETVSSSVGALFAKLDQWSTWGKIAGFLAVAGFVRLNLWLFGLVFSPHADRETKGRASLALFCMWIVVLAVSACYSQV